MKLLKTEFPLLWHYVAGVVDESCAPGQEYLDNMQCMDDKLAAGAEHELAASGLSGRQIWAATYDSPGDKLPVAGCPLAEDYVGFYVL